VKALVLWADRHSTNLGVRALAEGNVALIRAAYDVIVVDAPPLLPVTDAALLAAKAHGGLLVPSHGKVTRDQVAHSIERLEQVDARLVGLVINKVPTKSKSYGYGYGYEPAAAARHRSGSEWGE